MSKDPVADLVHRAQAELQRRHHQDARTLFFEALEIAPDHPDAHYGLATVSFRQGDVLAAAYHFREVVRRDPNRASAYVNLGAIYNHLGRDNDALTTLRKGIQLDPHRGEGYYNLGLVYRKLGKNQEAVAAYQEAVRLQPGMAEAHFNLANVLLDEGMTAEAIEQYREALKTRPNWPAARQGLEIAEAAIHEDNSDTVDQPPDEDRATREIDPNRHGAILRDIHALMPAAEGLGKSLGSDVAQQIEAALKELGACFLRPDTPGYTIAKRMEAFEAAAARVKQAHEELSQLREKLMTLAAGVREM